jgi:hypothetical protein
LGEKRFRALQTDKDAPLNVTQIDSMRFDATLAHHPNRRRRHSNEHDYLHIFSHPDSDRRLWLFTRSADPAVVS